MKKIINGRKYDTDTASALAVYSSGAATDLYYYEETLYIKKTGEYFLHGHGGPASVYGSFSESGNKIGGDLIIPFTEADAKAWAEKHISADDYCKIFGDVEE